MRFTTRLLLLAPLLIHLTAVPSRAALNVGAYVELTIARLELIETSWRENDESPSDQELAALYEEHGTDREEYFCFAGESMNKVDAYLENHPELRDTVETLAAEIRQRIAQRPED